LGLAAARGIPMEWFEPENRKRLFLIGGGGLGLILIVGIIYLSMGSEPPTDPNQEVARMTKYRQLGNLDALTKAAGSSDAQVKAAAIQQLPYFGQQAVEPIRRAVTDSNPSVRAMAIRSYAQVDHSAASLPWMQIAMKDPDADVRKAAAAAASQTQGAWELVPQLIANLDDKDREVRQAAVASLEQILGISLTKVNPKLPNLAYRVNDPAGSPNHAEVIARLREWTARPEVANHLKEYWSTHQWKGPK